MSSWSCAYVLLLHSCVHSLARRAEAKLKASLKLVRIDQISILNKLVTGISDFGLGAVLLRDSGPRNIVLGYGITRI
jgi:hypothetical protein